jgi:hypothetical protein
LLHDSWPTCLISLLVLIESSFITSIKKLFCVSVQKMDLNQLPPDCDYDFIDVEAANPTFCTQVGLAEATNQLQLPDCDSSLAANVANTLIHSDQNNEITPGYIADGVFEAHGMSPGGGGPAILDDVVEEVRCTPPIPYTGQSFASKQEEKCYYNACKKDWFLNSH